MWNEELNEGMRNEELNEGMGGFTIVLLGKDILFPNLTICSGESQKASIDQISIAPNTFITNIHYSFIH
jgi:hypothetical protein